MLRCAFAYVHGYFWHCVPHCLDVNECTEKGLCPGRCENTIGSYLCTSKDLLKNLPYEDCPPGYEWEPTTSLCTGMCSKFKDLRVIECVGYVDVQGVTELTDFKLRGPEVAPLIFTVNISRTKPQIPKR